LKIYKTRPLKIYKTRPLKIYKTRPLKIFKTRPLKIYKTRPLKIYKTRPLKIYKTRPLKIYKTRRGREAQWVAHLTRNLSFESKKAPVVSLSKKLYPQCLVLVGSRYGFEFEFTIPLKIFKILNYSYL